jgi:predicted nucleic acid-binding protein
VILVVDSSALITLARIGRLHLLRELADEVVVPYADYSEVVRRGVGRPGQTEVAQALWISRQRIRDRTARVRLETELARGESEAIILAKELAADCVILDDARARQIAELQGLRVSGLLGLLVLAKERGLIEAVKPVLDEMVKAGFYVGKLSIETSSKLRVRTNACSPFYVIGGRFFFMKSDIFVLW